MEQLSTPTRAYDLLEPFERGHVDEYVKYAISEQNKKRERIAHALGLPVPSEFVRRSKSTLARPLVRAAIAEQLQAAANEQDLSPDRVIKEHAAIAFSNIADYLEMMPLGDFVVKALDRIPKQALSAVKSMETIPGPYGLRTKITLQDKHPSLKALGELMGLVAPDKPVALREYSSPPPKSVENGGQAPEKAYLEYLNSCNP